MKRGGVVLIDEAYGSVEAAAAMLSETLRERLGVGSMYETGVGVIDDPLNEVLTSLGFGAVDLSIAFATLELEARLGVTLGQQLGRAMRTPAVVLRLLPGESSDRKQYEAPRFKRGKGRRQKDWV